VKSPGGIEVTTRSNLRAGRTWPLDRNLKELPDAFVKELTSITGYSLALIKYVLIYGEWPLQKSKL
jgi:hypothetical protein